jgi:hypothetical protein
MECNNFEEYGLLYASGELDPAAARGYEAHLEACDECRRETEAYGRERAELYTADVLSERPSPAADAEILRLCSNIRKTPTAFASTLFLNIKKYAPVPVFLMLVMAAVGGYLSYHSMTAYSLRTKYGTGGAGGQTAALPAQAPAENNGNAEEIAMSDSNAAAGTDSNAPMPRKQGNMGLEGVVTVKGEVKK